MNIDRVRHLVDHVLPNIKPEQFSMARWTDSCGTVCCAAGWAGSDPVFIDQGFELNLDLAEPTFEDQQGFDACAAFFEIDEATTTRWFDPWAYSSSHPSVATVIKRIRKDLEDAR
jgi:hypothetical protein